MKRTNRSAHSRRLRLELLEDRRLLAALSPAQPEVVLPSGGDESAAGDVVCAADDGLGSSFATDRSDTTTDRLHWLVHMPGDSAARRPDASIVQGMQPLGERTWSVQTTEPVTAESLAAALGLGSEGSVEPDYVVCALGYPNDPRYAELWGLNNTGQTGGTPDADIDAPEAWAISTGSVEIVVGVIDSGVDYTHPDLAANIWTNPGEIAGNGLDDDGNGYVDDVHGWDFANNDADPQDDNGHGTHVSGTIGATGDNGVGVIGVCPQVKILPLKFLGEDGSGYTSDAVEALQYVAALKARGVNIVLTNNSWGGGAFSQTLSDAIAAAGAQDVLFVAAAGNSGFNTDTSPSYPAGYDLPAVIAVAATDKNDSLASFSNYGATTVDLAAPGVSILSTIPGGQYAAYSGTSMATPHVCGALALLKAAVPALTASQLKSRLLARTEVVSGLVGNVATAGRLNAFNLLDPNWVPRPVDFQLTSVSLTDPSGNKDGMANPGETVNLAPTLFNAGGVTATATTIQIVSDDPRVTLVAPTTISLGTVGSLATATPSSSFRLQVAGSAGDLEELAVRFVVRYTESPAAATLPHEVLVVQLQPMGSVAVSFTPAGYPVADPVRNLVYLVDGTHRKVLAVDTQLGRTVAHADLGASGELGNQMAVSVEADRLFVGFREAQKIQVFSLPELEPLAMLSVPVPPQSIVHGCHNMLYVAGYGTSTIWKIDASTGAGLHQIACGEETCLRISRDGTRLFVGEQGIMIVGGPGYINEYDVDVPGAPAFVTGHPVIMTYLKDFAVDEQYQRVYSVHGRPYGVQQTDMVTGDYGVVWPFGSPYGAAVVVQADSPFVYGASPGPYDGRIRRYRRSDGLPLGDYPFNELMYDSVEITANGRLLCVTNHWTGSGDQYRIGIVGRSSLVIEGLPVARFTMDHDSGPPALSVAFNAAASADYEAAGTIVSYQWDFGGGAVASGKQVSHTFDACGTYTVRLTVTDNSGLSDDTVALVRVSHPPVAHDQAAQTSEDTAVAVQLRADDADADPLSYAVVAPPLHGSVTISDAVATYTPAADYFGPDQFTFLATDGRTQSAPATVTIGVLAVNDAPLAVEDRATTAIGAAVTTGDVRLNDRDVEGDALTIAAFTQPAYGSVVRNGGSFTYSPLSNFQGVDSFSYTVEDPSGARSTAEVRVAVSAAILEGDWPTLGNGPSHTGYFPGVIGPARPYLAWSAPLSGPTHQVAVAGEMVYAAASRTTLVALDADSGAEVWRQTFANSQLNPPTYADGTVYVQCGNAENSRLRALDAATGSVLWAAPYTEQMEQHMAPTVCAEQVWINGGTYGGMYAFDVADGSRTFFLKMAQIDSWTPSADDGRLFAWVGDTWWEFDATTRSFLRSGSLGGTTSSGMHTVPAVANGRVYLMSPTYVAAVDANTGSTLWKVSGSFTGTPAFAGGVVYAISGNAVNAYAADTGALLGAYPAGTALANQPIVTDDTLVVASATNTYLFNLASRQCVQTIAFGGQLSIADQRLYIASASQGLRAYAFAYEPGFAPTAANDQVTTLEDQPVEISVLANDTDPAGRPLVIFSTTGASHGTVSMIDSATLRYTPQANYFGQDTFTYEVANGCGGFAWATVSVTVTSVNDPPVAQNQNLIVVKNVAKAITLVATDVEGASLEYTVVDPPLHGTLSGSGASRTYTPATDYEGADQFTFWVGDGIDPSNLATVTLAVYGSVQALGQAVSTLEDTAKPIVLQAFGPGTSLTYSIVSAPAHGSLSGSGANRTYTPAANYSGSDQFTFKAYNGVSYSNVATVSITVQPVNDRPVAGADFAGTWLDTPVPIRNVLANDTDVEGDPLTFVSFTQPSQGVVAMNTEGTLVYTPFAGFTGVDQFTYVVRDLPGLEATGTVAVAVGELQLEGDWPTYGHDAAHTGYFPGSLLAGKLQPAWVASPFTAQLHQVAVAEDSIFVTSELFNKSLTSLIALRVEDGGELWRRDFSPNGSTLGNSLHPPTYDAGKVFVQRTNHTNDSQLWAVNAQTGGTVWSTAFSCQFPSYMAPTVAAGTVWVDTGYSNGLSAYREDTGALRYSVSTSNADKWAVSYYDGGAYAFLTGSFNRYNVDSGAVQWTVDFGYDSYWYSMGERIPAIADHTAFQCVSATTSTAPAGLYAIDVTDGVAAAARRLWGVAGTFTGTPAVAHGEVYAIADTAVKAYDARTGALLRTYAAGTALLSQPIVTDDGLIVASPTKTYVFHRPTGTLLDTVPYGGQISLANGSLYIACTDGKLRAYVFAPPEVNRPPQASADTASLELVDASTGMPSAAASVSVTLAVLANDTDPDSDPLVVQSVTSATYGTVRINADQTVTYTPAVVFAGTDQFQYTVSDGCGGTDTATVTIVATVVTPAHVVARRILYNHSAFDGDDAAADARDYDALAPAPAVSGHGHTGPADEPEKELGKQALRPGQSAGFVSYTSYANGINGIVIAFDALNDPAALSAADFCFRVGNDDDPSQWPPAPQPRGIRVEEDVSHPAFSNWPDVVTITWADEDPYTPAREPGAISNQWLQVTVLANARTGLAADDVFYFGNQIGESGNSAADTNVDQNDEIGARNHPHTAFSPAAIGDPYDFNRDGKVDQNDEILARNTPASAFTRIALIAAPATLLAQSSAAAKTPAEDPLPQAMVASVIHRASSRWEAAGRDTGLRPILEQTPLQDGLDDDFRQLGRAAAEKLDLLAAVMHEIGNVPGKPATEAMTDDLMAGRVHGRVRRGLSAQMPGLHQAVFGEAWERCTAAGKQPSLVSITAIT